MGENTPSLRSVVGHTMNIAELVKALINTAEKGANIARIIRSEPELLNLLVQEKKGDQKNDRFLHDFKTLADVLVQEMVRNDLSKQFPGIGESIFGEESNKFTNTLGETVTVRILETREETSTLLCSVLNDNRKAAELLASVIHEDVEKSAGPELESIENINVDVRDVGVWIDPIDSTAQYIDGIDGAVNDSGLVSEGLQCVAVLIGVYHKTTGLPIVGIANRPFSLLDVVKKRWIGEYMWGVCINNTNVSSIPSTNFCAITSSGSFSEQGTEPSAINPERKKLVLMSRSEKDQIKEIFQPDFAISHAAGAGYKLLCVNQNVADAYVLSKNTTFKWDCCGPHAILLSLGGGIISYKSLLDIVTDDSDLISDKHVDLQLKYNRSDNPSQTGASKWCNEGGLVAYHSKEVLFRIIDVLKR